MGLGANGYSLCNDHSQHNDLNRLSPYNDHSR
jgi:hypothetical protein